MCVMQNQYGTTPYLQTLRHRGPDVHKGSNMHSTNCGTYGRPNQTAYHDPALPRPITIQSVLFLPEGASD